MSDLISREFLLKSIDYIADIGGIWGRAFTAYKEAFKEFVEGMPPAQRWVPVSERLPEEDEEVLATVHFLGIKDVKESWYVDLSKQIGGEWCGYSDEFRVAPKRHKTIAWMPLPDPYMGDE